MKPIVYYIKEPINIDFYHPTDRADLVKSIINLYYSEWSKIDTSKVEDMSYLFYEYKRRKHQTVSCSLLLANSIGEVLRSI